jgi:hypothetical protein
MKESMKESYLQPAFDRCAAINARINRFMHKNEGNIPRILAAAVVQAPVLAVATAIEIAAMTANTEQIDRSMLWSCADKKNARVKVLPTYKYFG